jgi:phage repressor protein C with HTH and peptisase S24 domain
MSTLGERLRQVRGALSREVAAERLCVHPGTLQKYEADKRVPDAIFVLNFCNTFNIDEHWLLRGEGPTDKPKLLNESAVRDVHSRFLGAEGETQHLGLVPVPFYEARAGAGAVQISWDEQPTKRVFLPNEIFRARGLRPDCAGLMLGSGSSMEPTISDGDLLMVDLSDQSRSDGIFVVGRDGGVLVKRLQWRSDRSLVMISDNKSFEPELLPRDDADDLRLIGRVRMVFKSV